MEPGHEDREYVDFLGRLGTSFTPQWSPVMKTGNTSAPFWVCRMSSCLNGARS